MEAIKSIYIYIYVFNSGRDTPDSQNRPEMSGTRPRTPQEQPNGRTSNKKYKKLSKSRHVDNNLRQSHETKCRLGSSTRPLQRALQKVGVLTRTPRSPEASGRPPKALRVPSRGLWGPPGGPRGPAQTKAKNHETKRD